MDGKIISAEQAVHDLTLALLYLTRFKEGRGKQEDQLFRAWLRLGCAGQAQRRRVYA